MEESWGTPGQMSSDQESSFESFGSTPGGACQIRRGVGVIPFPSLPEEGDTPDKEMHRFSSEGSSCLGLGGRCSYFLLTHSLVE